MKSELTIVEDNKISTSSLHVKYCPLVSLIIVTYSLIDVIDRKLGGIKLMIRVGIIGVTGYTGIETLRMLSLHPEVKITLVMTQTYEGMDIAQVYPHLAKRIFLQGKKIDLDAIIENCDVIFISLPHGNASTIVQPLLAAGKKIIDLGPDFRLKKSADYQKWYQLESAPEKLLSQAVYGLPEITNKDMIAKAQLIANPGCVPTAAILATAPALKEKIIHDECIFDVKVGLSGYGRKPSIMSMYAEIDENIAPFNTSGTHRHTPEIEQELSLIAQKSMIVQFSPHTVPMIRGILATCYFKLSAILSEEEVITIYKRFYEKESFIRICPLKKMARVKSVRGTNYCDISIHVNPRNQQLIVLSTIDNLIKGAGGQAIQNMNLMHQLPETTGLDQYIAIYP
ncbi:MAG: N-acetyl-gamma-glutamyl-phosphate reductase [Gammaproteobacteria bacterium]|jgi:N-acetyl-gamma-glutamyl-phosphate reductase|nr:N-acetyl-gamma-glutamyl-phosphate reductase [Gammaproteobacteria bacterium]